MILVGIRFLNGVTVSEAKVEKCVGGGFHQRGVAMVDDSKLRA